ncbi:unnamed protein product [Eruca vesicaria subsp. sativa]|uniref:NAC domain-containing protein n=1 Tax=Eruca vesicaria subsp. sativa TaxID=29727 RepID=A0ABC8KNI8_ERUVS|nr:unnamed protein product [Eruca vesicaria subsp. sativa]
MAMSSSSNNRKEDPSSPPQTPSSSSAADNFCRTPREKPTTFPPGYKFVPSEEDLIVHYLKPFLRSNKNPPPNVPIHRVNIYESNPERLSREYVKGNDKEWFFITERTKMHEGGTKKHSRLDNGGFWKARSAFEEFKTRKGEAFWRMVLEHYTGNNQNGARSEWLMYEYVTDSSSPRDKTNGDNNKRVDYALCKIYMTPKGMKRKAEEEEENEKRKKEEERGGGEEQEVDQRCPFSSDEFRELMNSLSVPGEVDGVFTGPIDLSPLFGEGESKKD